MALWTGVGQVANITQLTGVDAYGLISMIVEAAKTVKRNHETCQQLARRAGMIGDLLHQLQQSSQLMQHVETRNPMEQLEEALRHAYVLIAACGDRNYLHSCFTGGQLAEQLRQVQEEINFGLLLFPIISFVDNTRTSERLMNRDRPSCSEATTDGLDRPHHSKYDDGLRTKDLEAIKFNPQQNSGGKLTEGQVLDIGKLANLIGGRKVELSDFSFSQILAATKKFSAGNLIDSGGFGDVYKGKLSNGLDIAVKRHSTYSIQGPEEFSTEVEVIPNLRHKSIISLLGCCTQRGEKVLVYEYMENRSLASIISAEEKRVLLSWFKRLQIIKAVADGLAYLHGHSDMCIVHRNLGSRDILLDQDMNAKISDFGFAILLAPNTYAKDVKVVGTHGHQAPEYVVSGRISEKVDVYNFGVVLLEIICGKRYRSDMMAGGILTLCDFVSTHCIHAWKLVDPLLLNDEWLEMDQIMGCIKVALLCTHSLPEDRPAMWEVVAMLDSIQALQP